MNRMLRLGVSLRTRLTLWYGALLALTLLAFSAVLYFTLQQNLSTSVDQRLTLRADQIQREVGPSLGTFLQPEDVAPGQLESTLNAFVEPGIYVQVLNPRGAVVAAPPSLFGGALPVPETSRQAIAEDRRVFDRVPVAAGDASVRLLTVPIHHPDTGEVVGAVQVGESLAPLDATMAAVERLLLLAAAIALLLAVVVGWLLTRAALSPVARITETARHIAATGDYRQRLHVTPPRLGHGDELFFLAATFNDMIARLEHMLESQRRLLADTSHELRNPITVIRGNLALLRRDGVPEATRQEAVLEAEEEAARMGRLVGDLLLLARADAGQSASLRHDLVDLAELATEVVDRARPLAGTRRLSVSTAGRCEVLGDRDRLKQLIGNLVENGVRYTPLGGRIDVRVTGDMQQPAGAVRSRSERDPRTSSTSTSMALLSVSDTGIGISPTDLPHVFERFYRADKARSRAYGGSGLGLSIAQYVAQVHGGSVEAASDGANRGSTFTVRLPLASASASASTSSRTSAAAIAASSVAGPIALLLLVLALWLPTTVFADADSSTTAPAPSGITVDADGNVYVSDYALDRIVKFAPDGTVLAQWGSSGASVGQFNAPFGVSLDEHGSVYVADQLNNRIQRFASDGTPLGAWGAAGAATGELRTPFGVAYAGGRLYVADFGNDRVQVFSPDGTVALALGARGSGDGQFLRPAGVAVDRDGALYVTDHFNDRVQKFGPDGHFAMQLGTAAPAVPVAAAAAVASPSSVAGTPAPTATLSVTPTLAAASATVAATATPALGDAPLRRPEGISLDRDGNLCVADFGHDRIVRLAPDGHVLQTLGARGSGAGEYVGPKGVAVDPQSGRLYVADTGNARVQRLAPDGTPEASWSMPPTLVSAGATIAPGAGAATATSTGTPTTSPAPASPTPATS